jgi:flagellar biosynthesis GTPase FlhF
MKITFEGTLPQIINQARHFIARFEDIPKEPEITITYGFSSSSTEAEQESQQEETPAPEKKVAKKKAAKKKTSKKKASKKTEQAEEPVESDEPDSSPIPPSDAPAEITKADLTKALQDVISAVGLPKAKELLNSKFEAGQLSDVPEDRYQEFVTECKLVIEGE